MHATRPDRAAPRRAPSLKLPAFIAEAPVLFAGATLSLAAMVAIFANAIWFQPGDHPSPLFASRAPMSAQEAPTKVAMAEKAVVEPRKARTVAVKAQPDGGASKDVLREVQTALSVRGYYEGKLDGVYGSRTEGAIAAFQRDHSMPQTGTASVRLLTQILMSASASPSQVPVPKPTQLAARATADEQVASAATEAPAADGLIARIQSGLREYGYDEIVVDGKMGRQTATAIQRFQLDFGMKITGEPSTGVLDKLREVGAYQQG